MKRLWLLIALGGVLSSLDCHAQDACTKTRKLIDKINSVHIQPKALNDSLSQEIFSEFFKVLDPVGRYLVSKDTANLAVYKKKLDDGNDQVCSFIAASTSMFHKKVEWYKHFTDSILAKPLDLNKKEFGATIITRSFDIAKNNAELKDRITKELKEKVLLGIWRYSVIDSTILTNAAGFTKAELTSRQRVRKKELARVDKFLLNEKEFNVDGGNSYLKSIPHVFDPHSTFFSKEDLAAFTEILNPSALSFGIKLDESATGEVSVSGVVPGGPAWNSNQINEEDVLVGMQWKASGEYVDFSDLDIDEIEHDLDRQDEVSGELMIRKSTGEIRKVKLVKGRLENEENLVSGFVLRNKDTKRSVGYINLPGFFTDSNSDKQGCAAAVTRELIKLKAESIEGLILDLRYNGGGSLGEAMDLTGLFIDVGPVGMAELRGKSPEILKDMNRGTVYDGPMVIMVNGASASASEIFAAAMQDLHRAVIAGSTTYGKATGQMIVAIDESKPLDGFLKVTDMRLYRINGQSHQGTGVIPDYPMHDLTFVYEREEQEAYTLKPKTTTRKAYYTPSTKSYADAIKYTLNNNPNTAGFDNMKDLEALYVEKIPLERKAFLSFMKSIENAVEKFGGGNNETNIYSVSNSKFDTTLLQVDAYRNEMNKQILGQVRSSIYIQEAYRLLDNMISGKK